MGNSSIHGQSLLFLKIHKALSSKKIQWRNFSGYRMQRTAWVAGWESKLTAFVQFLWVRKGTLATLGPRAPWWGIKTLARTWIRKGNQSYITVNTLGTRILVQSDYAALGKQVTYMPPCSHAGLTVSGHRHFHPAVTAQSQSSWPTRHPAQHSTKVSSSLFPFPFLTRAREKENYEISFVRFPNPHLISTFESTFIHYCECYIGQLKKDKYPYGLWNKISMKEEDEGQCKSLRITLICTFIVSIIVSSAPLRFFGGFQSYCS